MSYVTVGLRQGENCRGVAGLNPPSYIINPPQLMLLGAPQGVGITPPTMTNVNKCMG